MMSKIGSLILSSTLLSLAALPGCSEQSIEHDATFATATAKQVKRAYQASSGFDQLLALLAADHWFGKNDPTGCPAIVTRGAVTTVTGGCSTEEGGRIEGKAEIRNMPDFDRFPSDRPTEPGSIEIDLSLRAMSPDTEHVAFKGDVEIDPDAGFRGDLTLTYEGITSRSRLGIELGSDESLTLAPDSEIEISDVGGAGVEGTWRYSDPPSGRLILRGADELVFDMAHPTDDGCIPYEAGANRGTVCDTTIEERRAAGLAPGLVLADPRVSLLSRALLPAKR